MMNKKLSYAELIKLKTFEERLLYLQQYQRVANATFGQEREMNQRFYRSTEWRQLRNSIIIRDNGCDLAVPGYTIYDRIYIHHINPLTINDFAESNSSLFDEENLVCVSFNTHQLIHYGTISSVKASGIINRKKNDTKLW